jgi:signal recognition particle GTPase
MNRASGWKPRARRLHVEMPILYRSSSTEPWVEGTIRNVSQSGVYFTTPGAMPATSALEVIFTMPQEIAGQPDADPGAVAYDAVQAAISRKSDIVLVDTAGRLHTRYNLMEELKKVYRVVGKALPGAPHAVWLVLDATTGQNALNQARAFKDAVKVNGVILAKLDSSAKGGMAFAIKRELGLPILYAGLGEKPEDLTRFDREAFVDGILQKRA